jgi:hypothetical protein
MHSLNAHSELLDSEIWKRIMVYDDLEARWTCSIENEVSVREGRGNARERDEVR